MHPDLIRQISIAAAICLCARGAMALPPPAHVSTTFSEVAPDGRLYLNVTFGGSPNGVAHQQNAVAQHGGYRFVTYYDDDFHLCLARKHLYGSVWTTITFDSLVPPTGNPADADSHDSTNVGISVNDGRIHLAYGHHTDNLRYRISSPSAATVSDVNFTAALFSTEQNYLKAGTPLTQVTYPIFLTRESDGKFYMFWRERFSGNGDIFMSDYLDNGDWSGKRKVIDGATQTYVDPTGRYANSLKRCAYPNDIVNKGNEFQMTWCWRENAGNGSSPIPNHDLMYARSVDGGETWQNSAGTTVGTSGTGSYKMNLASPVKVWDIDYDWNILNSTSTRIDSNGSTHTVLLHNADDTGTGPRRYWHYVRTGTSWSRTLLPFTFSDGKRPKIFVDQTSTFDVGGNPVPCNTVYIVGNVDTYLNVYASQAYPESGAAWKTWTNVYSSQVDGRRYRNELNGFIGPAGNLVILAHRRGATNDSISSPVELVQINIDPTP